MKGDSVNNILFIILNSVITMSVLLSIEAIVMTDMKIPNKINWKRKQKYIKIVRRNLYVPSVYNIKCYTVSSEQLSGFERFRPPYAMIKMFK